MFSSNEMNINKDDGIMKMDWIDLARNVVAVVAFFFVLLTFYRIDFHAIQRMCISKVNAFAER